MRPYFKILYSVCFLIVMLWLSYALAVKKTIALKQGLVLKEQKTSLLNQYQQSYSILLFKEKEIDTVLKKMSIDYDNIDNSLLYQVSKYAKNNQLKIRSFIAPHIFSFNEERVESTQLTIEGDYNNISKFLYELENTMSIGNPVHYELKSETDFTDSKKKKLILSLLIENRKNTL